MILKGSQRCGAKALALHLLNEADNDHVEVHSVHGFMSCDVEGALQEIQAIARGTNCKQFMFSLSLSPPQDAVVADQDFLDAIQQSMKKLGLAGQPHVTIFHEKNARRHCHVVISRIDTDQMKAINLPFFKDRLCELSRELYLAHGWEMPKGHEDRMLSDPLNYSLEEHQVAKRAKRDPKAIKALLQECWALSDSAASFASVLQENGFKLCRGDRRGIVALDAQGNIYSLSRWLGVKAKDLKARLGNPNLMPDIESTLEVLAAEPSTHDSDQFLSQFDVRMAELLRRKKQLKDAQRRARFDFRDKHQALKLARNQELRQNLTGLRGLWNFIQGNRKELIATHTAALEVVAETAQMEMLGLSKQQRDARRILQNEITELQSRRDAKLGRAPAPAQLRDADARVPDAEELRIAARVRRNPALILDIIMAHKSRFTRNDILRALSRYVPDLVEHRAAASTVMASENLVQVDDNATPKYTTREFLKLETHMAGLARTMASTKSFGVSPRNLKSAIQTQNKALQKSVGAILSEQQRRAITHLVNRRQLSVVIGFAGSGKSTMLSAARDAWEKQGYRVIGAALAGKAADSLQNASGIPSRTLASYELSWENRRNLLQPGDVIVIDEAGMIGSRQLVRFIEEAHKRRCKIVLVGDPDQLQPINAGTPFRDITDHIGCARLTEIRRQRSKWQRQASLDLAEGRVEEAMVAYDAHDAIQTEETQEDAITALIEDYMADWELTGDDTSRIALAHRRVDVRALNEGIRAARKSAGELSNEITFETDNGMRKFSLGDRIMFTRNDAQLGVKNGMLGIVEKISGIAIEICIDGPGDSNRSQRLTVSPKRYSALEHGYATTIHRSQGATVDSCFVLGSRSMNAQLKYVAMTRHKRLLKFYDRRDESTQRNGFSSSRTFTHESNLRAPQQGGQEPYL